MPALTPPPGQPVPRSTMLLVAAMMLLFFSFGVDLSVGATWVWWLIPLAALAVLGVIVVQRATTH